MADLSVTAASVQPTSSTKRQTKIAGAAITAGQAVYVDSSNLVQLADADSSATTAAAVGISMNDAASGQPVSYAYEGTLDMGSIITAGEIYVVSGTAGGIAPKADLASGDYVTILATGSDTDTVTIDINASGDQV